MNQLILIIIALISTSSVFGQARHDCQTSFTQFCFEFVRSFDERIVISLDNSPERSSLFVQIYSEPELDQPEVVESRYSVDLSSDQISDLEERLVLALRIPRKDDGFGTDGSVWFLETEQGGFYIRVGYWSPLWNANERQLKDFAKFGALLWELAGIAEQDVGLLY